MAIFDDEWRGCALLRHEAVQSNGCIVSLTIQSVPDFNKPLVLRIISALKWSSDECAPHALSYSRNDIPSMFGLRRSIWDHIEPPFEAKAASHPRITFYSSKEWTLCPGSRWRHFHLETLLTVYALSTVLPSLRYFICVATRFIVWTSSCNFARVEMNSSIFSQASSLGFQWRNCALVFRCPSRAT